LRIALTGGTGFVGRAVIEQALASGHEVRALARKPQAPRAGMTWVAGDLANEAALTELVAGSEAVIHVAGLVNAPSPAEFNAANVDGTQAVLDAALAAGAARFVFVSSLSAREPQLSAYGTSKARAEPLVRSAAIDWTIVRPPAVYGPYDREMFELFRAAKWGLVPVPGHGRASVIHVDDLARLLLALAPASEAARHATFEPDDGRPGGWDHHALALAIGAAVGRRPRVWHVSRAVMTRAAKADMWLRKAGAKLTLDRVGYMTHPDWVVSASARPPANLWRPQVDTGEGLEATARWYREQRWL
jgi:nucleoside-diphosphate-sugar epimerase